MVTLEKIRAIMKNQTERNMETEFNFRAEGLCQGVEG